MIGTRVSSIKIEELRIKVKVETLPLYSCQVYTKFFFFTFDMKFRVPLRTAVIIRRMPAIR